MTGPVTQAIRATEADHEPNRRAVFAGLAMVSFLPRPSQAAPSGIVALCDATVARAKWVDTDAHKPSWDDERINAEIETYNRACLRAVNEPAVTLAEVQAKARLALWEFEEALFLFIDPAENAKIEAGMSTGERLTRAVLREIIALRA